MTYNPEREHALRVVVDYVLDGLARVHWKKGRLAEADIELTRALRKLLHVEPRPAPDPSPPARICPHCRRDLES